MTQANLLNLYQQLLQFGLDPNEWFIQPLHLETFEICKIDDPEFRLQGEIQNFKWTQIWVTSI